MLAHVLAAADSGDILADLTLQGVSEPCQRKTTDCRLLISIILPQRGVTHLILSSTRTM
jgi:hypothetical protein